MIQLTVAIFIFISNLSFAADAQERIVIGTQRLSENGALFLAAAEGYFKAEGIDLAMTAYDSDKVVADMVASGATDFGLARFTPAAFDAAGKGLIRAIAAQAREKRDYEGSQIIASSIGFQKGLRKFDNLADKTVAIDALGSTAHYQLLQIARIKHVDPARITVKALGTLDAIARATATTIAGYVYPDRGMRPLRSSSALITSIHRRDSMSPTSRARSPGTSRKA